MKAYLDTSALIRAWCVGVVPKGITRAHSVAEFFCVLSGPGLLTVIDGKMVKIPVTPTEANQAILETFANLKFHDVTGREALATLTFAAKAGMSGRLIHDWMHAESAALAGCDTFVTLNAKDFVRILDPKIELVTPTDYFARQRNSR